MDESHGAAEGSSPVEERKSSVESGSSNGEDLERHSGFHRSMQQISAGLDLDEEDRYGRLPPAVGADLLASPGGAADVHGRGSLPSAAPGVGPHPHPWPGEHRPPPTQASGPRQGQAEGEAGGQAGDAGVVEVGLPDLIRALSESVPGEDLALADERQAALGNLAYMREIIADGPAPPPLETGAPVEPAQLRPAEAPAEPDAAEGDDETPFQPGGTL
jgi:hypothetical protein